MRAFRMLLVAFFVCIVAYTAIVGVNHGWNLLPIVLESVASMTWTGQFNFDFMTYLVLSALWIAWRHHFSPSGLALGVLGFVGGILFFAPYLLFSSLQANGDMKELLLGKVRANS